jgi:hypothetical protein
VSGVDETIPLLTERAATEGPRSTRAVEIISSTPSERFAAALLTDFLSSLREGCYSELSARLLLLPFHLCLASMELH